MAAMQENLSLTNPAHSASAHTSDFRQTSNGAHVNKASYLFGIQNIILGSKVRR